MATKILKTSTKNLQILLQVLEVAKGWLEPQQLTALKQLESPM